MYFLVLVYLQLYIKLDFKVYLRQNTPALASSSRRGGLATEPRPGVRLSTGVPGPSERRAQRRAGDRRRAAPAAQTPARGGSLEKRATRAAERASGGAWRRWMCGGASERRSAFKRGSFRRFVRR